MSHTLKLALLSLAIGSAMGLVVMAAAAAAGQRQRLVFWAGGTVWATIDVGLLLTDCLRHARGPISEAALPIFFVGVALWPMVLSWGQAQWLLRWCLAQVIMLAAIGPAFFAAVVAAMCTFT